ncbi:DUF2147 domain-containing protein [Lichenibacterium ramalinae]|uniref:DUF2147 domain-containing protein n=1 Tax=Lichenibacterium ramalinae TaxID=2316527 RepID=UPI0013EA03D8|nr:DUF2147 domain-containing protein [Lichenibacterium ramalinae]
MISGLVLSTVWFGSCAAGTAGAEGVWTREDGAGSVRIARCGDALCGHIVWLRDAAGPGRMGDRVFYDMKASAADRWSGSAHNPEDGRDYAGTMVLAGDRLVTEGCALGGLVCKTVRFLRRP